MPPSPTTMTSYTASGGSSEGGEALGDVHERRILGRDLSEQGASGGDVAGPLVEVGQRVPEAEMVGEDPLRSPRRTLEQLDRLLELSLICQRAGGDDPALGHDRGARRRGAKFLPELLDPLVLPERPGDVHEDWVLVHRVGQPDYDVKLLLGRVLLPEPVVGHPQQFAKIDAVWEEL